MLLGYNTNGFAHHRLEDAIRILAEHGYQSVAITLDYHALNPFDPHLREQLAVVKELMHTLHLRCVIETGARFLLDPWNKHQPTLLSREEVGRKTRLDFLCRAVDIANELGSDAVSFWSGAPTEGATSTTLMDRLVEGCTALCAYAAERDIRLAFEPEPGMFIDTMDRFADLQRHLPQDNFGLTIDIGHLHCQGEEPIAGHLRRWAPLLWNVHIEDMRRGVHEHLMFGEGDIVFGPIMRTLDAIGYAGGVHVELSRHSHDAVATARRAAAYLKSVTSCNIH